MTKIYVFQQCEYVGATTLNPEIHRVAGDQFGFFHLLENVELEPWIDVGQKKIRRRAKLLRNLGAEVREHTEVCFQRLGGVQIVAVSPAPAERAALRALEAAEIHAALLQWIQLFDRIVRPHDSNDTHFGEMARRRGEECRGSAEHIVGFPERSLH